MVSEVSRLVDQLNYFGSPHWIAWIGRWTSMLLNGYQDVKKNALTSHLRAIFHCTRANIPISRFGGWFQSDLLLHVVYGEVGSWNALETEQNHNDRVIVCSISVRVDSDMNHLVGWAFVLKRNWNLKARGLKCQSEITETYWDILRHTETYWDILRHTETYWDILRPFTTPPHVSYIYIYIPEDPCMEYLPTLTPKVI